AHATKATHSFVQPATGPAADAAVKAMWQTFFNGTVPIPRRLGLLQDSQRFSSFVKSEEKTSLGALVLAASGKVTKVAVTAPGKASCTFRVRAGGKASRKESASPRRLLWRALAGGRQLLLRAAAQGLWQEVAHPSRGLRSLTMTPAAAVPASIAGTGWRGRSVA